MNGNGMVHSCNSNPNAAAATPAMLPMDLMAEILARLPVKSIIRFKCVCKSWNALISDPYFIKKQLRTSSTDPNHHYVMVADSGSPSSAQFPVNLSDYFLPSLLHRSSSSTFSQLNLPPCDDLFKVKVSIIGACHGILCISIPRTSPVLWNPSIRSFKKLPLVTWPDLDPPSYLNRWCFGYDHLSHTYKAVAVLFYNSLGLGGYGTHVMLHTLGSDSWRSIQEFPITFVNFSYAKFASGTFNWLCLHDNNNLLSSGCSIVSLDVGTERYNQLLLPDGLSQVRFCRLEIDEVKGCLSIVAIRNIDHSHFTDVWIMKEYGNKESWTKLFSIPWWFEGDPQDYVLVPEALWISDEDDEILLMDALHLTVYNSKTESFKYQSILKAGTYISAAAYAESLISPCF